MNKLSLGKTLVATALLGILGAVPAWAQTMEMTLDKAVKLALLNNADIKISQANLQAAKAQKTGAKAAKFGAITFKHTFTRGAYHHEQPVQKPLTGEVYYTKNFSTAFNNGVTFTLPIFTGGELAGNIDYYSRSYKVARYGLEDTLEQVKLDATKGFYTILQCTNTVKLAEESVERLAQHLKNVEAQYRVGTVAKADVLRSRVELADAQQSLISARNAYDLAVAKMNYIMGLAQDTELKITEVLKYQEYNNTLDNCLTFALANRPDLHQARLSVGMAEAKKKIANSGNLPQISASASNSWSKSEWPGDDASKWAVGVSLSMNVFDFGVTAAKVAAAKAGVISAEEQYRQAEDKARLAVRQSYLGLREAEKRISTTEVAVSQAEEDYKIAQLRYQAGVGTNTDVMDASVALTKAKNNYNQALYDYNSSGASLDKDMGVPVIIDEKMMREMEKTGATVESAKAASDAAKAQKALKVAKKK